MLPKERAENDPHPHATNRTAITRIEYRLKDSFAAQAVQIPSVYRGFQPLPTIGYATTLFGKIDPDWKGDRDEFRNKHSPLFRNKTW